MEKTNKIAIIIPALNPDEKLIRLIEDINKAEFNTIIVVNDGSNVNYNKYFKEAENMGCIILTNYVNQGKGRALKIAFNYILNEEREILGAITVDSDGQHGIKDIIKCSERLCKKKDNLIMGCRDFKAAGIPFKSRFGNILTRSLMRILCGIKLSDTQTGLRGFSRSLMERFLAVDGERFEYEMNMLMYTKNMDIKLEEVPIETIYIEENKSTHFNPIVDSIKIYSVFFKFLLSSITSFIIDVGMFTLLVLLLKKATPAYYILIGTIGARVISALINFAINKNRVFNNKEKGSGAAIKYSILCVVQLIMSYLGVYYVYKVLGWNESIIKIMVDTILFLISFQIQREWVFKAKNILEKDISTQI